MHVTVEYAAQIKRAVGTASQTVELSDGAGLNDLFARLHDLHGEALNGVLLTAAGEVHPSVLVFVGDEQIRDAIDCKLTDGERVSLLSPISGG